MGVRLPIGPVVSKVVETVDREAVDAALRRVRSSISPGHAPYVPDKPWPKQKDWSGRILLGIGGIAGASYVTSSSPPPAPPEDPDQRRVPMRGQSQPALKVAAPTLRPAYEAPPLEQGFWDGLWAKATGGDDYRKPKAAANFFDKHDNDTEFWNGKAEDLPAPVNFDDRFRNATDLIGSLN